MDDAHDGERPPLGNEGNEVGVDAPEPDQGILREILAYVTDSWLLGQEAEGLTKLANDVLRRRNSALLGDVIRDVDQVLPGSLR